MQSLPAASRGSCQIEQRHFPPAVSPRSFNSGATLDTSFVDLLVFLIEIPFRIIRFRGTQFNQRADFDIGNHLGLLRKNPIDFLTGTCVAGHPPSTQTITPPHPRRLQTHITHLTTCLPPVVPQRRHRTGEAVRDRWEEDSIYLHVSKT